jgi:hypothetical protein
MAAMEILRHRSRSRHAVNQEGVYPREKFKMPAAPGGIAASIRLVANASRKWFDK